MSPVVLASILTFLVAPTNDGAQANAQSKKSTSQDGPTAEDILRTLRQRRPANDVIPPGSAKQGDAESRSRPERLLWPEGSTWIERTGRLERDGDWWRFVDDAPDGSAMRLLPNANLEVMVRTLRGKAESSTFQVSGEITVFGGRAHLIVRSSVRGRTAQTEPTVAPPKASSGASAASVLEKMQNLQPTEAPLTNDSGSRVDAPSAAANSTTHLLLDGTPVIRRVGRVTRQAGWWVFTSDSDRADAPDAPMRLLPNQALEMMVNDVQGGGSSSYILSGEATLFFGENYLLPRVATRKVDLGNLRK